MVNYDFELRGDKDENEMESWKCDIWIGIIDHDGM